MIGTRNDASKITTQAHDVHESIGSLTYYEDTQKESKNKA